MMSGQGPTNIVRLTARSLVLEFNRVELAFSSRNSGRPVWAEKNNKSVRETLLHERYAKLAPACARYGAELDEPLGEFLYRLSQRGDVFYKRFLNLHGEAEFGEFVLAAGRSQSQKGLYLYHLGEELVYVGRCLDSFGKRINQGYGKIHPKNCYLDGQSTNCRMNSLVWSNRNLVGFFVCPMDDDERTKAVESELLRNLRPPWNKQLA